MLNLLILCLIVESFKLLFLNCSKFITRVLQIGIGTTYIIFYNGYKFYEYYLRL